MSDDLMRELAKLAKGENCKRCGGKGTVRVKHGRTFETDSADERADAWHTEACPECRGITIQACPYCLDDVALDAPSTICDKPPCQARHAEAARLESRIRTLAGQIVAIERDANNAQRRAAFLRGARAAKAQVLESLEGARFGNPSYRMSAIDFIATLADPEYTEGEQ